MIKRAYATATLAILLGCTGCTTTTPLSPASIDQISQSCGLVSGMAFAANNKASPAVCTVVSNVLSQFSMNVAYTTNGITTTFLATYGNSIGAAVQADTSMKPSEKALVQVGATIALTSLDSLFSMHPEWKKNADTVNVAVQCFVSGVQIGMNSIQR